MPHNETERLQALHIVEALRTGVASRRVSSHFPHGRQEILESVDFDLSAVGQDGDPLGKVISASYGQGKTHLLNQILTFAHARKFAVANLVISKETPIHNLKRLYQKVATSVVLPGEQEAGLERQLGTLRPAGKEVQDLLYYAANHLHPRLHHVLNGYFSATDPYDQFLLYGDLVGDFLPITQIRDILKRSTGIKDRIPTLPAEQAGQYFLLLSALIRQLGYGGLVILFDEAELLGALGVISRMKAYLHLASLLGLGGPFRAKFLYTVFFFASGFYADVLVGKKELEQVKAKAPDRFGDDHANLILSFIDFLLTDRTELRDLTQPQIEELLHEIHRLHGIAYQWEPTFDMEQVLAKTEGAPLRTTIRGAVEYLDLTLLYRENPVIAVQSLNEIIPQEDEELFASEDVSNSENVD